MPTFGHVDTKFFLFQIKVGSAKLHTFACVIDPFLILQNPTLNCYNNQSLQMYITRYLKYILLLNSHNHMATHPLSTLYTVVHLI